MKRPKGTRDFWGEEAETRRWAIQTVEEVFRKYGYSPLYTPALESLEVLEAKAGEGIQGEIFRIEGGLGLRFDLTVPMVRFFLSHRDIPLPFKRYQIQEVFRREEPQRGRLREFLQADIDTVGGKEPFPDVETVVVLWEALEALGLKTRVLLNSRRPFDEFPAKALRLLDKMDRLGRQEVLRRAEESGVGEWVERALQGEVAYEEEFLRAVDLLKEQGIPVEVSPTTVRGLDYYSGMVFEFKTQGTPLTVAAGGRYDRLFQIFGYDYSAVGGSIGIDRVLSLLAPRKKILPAIVVWREVFSYALKVARKRGGLVFPKEGIREGLAFASGKAKLAFVVGPREAAAGSITVKNLETGEQWEEAL